MGYRAASTDLLGRAQISSRLGRNGVVGKEVAMVLVGIDWSEKWHDVCLMDESGVLSRRRVEDSLPGLTQTPVPDRRTGK